MLQVSKKGAAMKRVGRIVKVKLEMKDRYIELHANPWSEVSKAIYACGIRNFSIFVKGEMLFSYFEYIGTDYEADMERLDHLTKDWLKETDACQTPVEDAADDELWCEMETIFYQQ